MFLVFWSEKPQIFKYSHSTWMMLRREHERQHLEQDFLWMGLVNC